MKHTLFAIFFICCLMSVRGQQQSIVLNPLIGDTLDAAERDTYRLLQNVDGYQWGVFYLNADSTVSARVHILRDGLQRDTVINHYRSLAALRYQIDYVQSEQSQIEKERLKFNVPQKTFVNAALGHGHEYNAFWFGGTVQLVEALNIITLISFGGDERHSDFTLLSRLGFQFGKFSTEIGAMYFAGDFSLLRPSLKNKKLYPSIVIKFEPTNYGFFSFSMYDNSNIFVTPYCGSLGLRFSEKLHQVVISVGNTGWDEHGHVPYFDPAIFLSINSDWHFWSRSWLMFNIAKGQIFHKEFFFAVGLRQSF